MKCRYLQVAVVGLLTVAGWLTIKPQPAHGQVVAIWGWRNFGAPIFGGPWIAPDVRFRPLGILDANRSTYDELPAPNASAQVTVTVPHANAQVWVQDELATMTGRQRIFLSPPLESGLTYSYEIRARWQHDSQTVERIRTVSFRPGQRVHVDFSRPASP